jgi:hypothetical protein
VDLPRSAPLALLKQGTRNKAGKRLFRLAVTKQKAIERGPIPGRSIAVRQSGARGQKQHDMTSDALRLNERETFRRPADATKTTTLKAKRSVRQTHSDWYAAGDKQRSNAQPARFRATAEPSFGNSRLFERHMRRSRGRRDNRWIERGHLPDTLRIDWERIAVTDWTWTGKVCGRGKAKDNARTGPVRGMYADTDVPWPWPASLWPLREFRANFAQ